MLQLDIFSFSSSLQLPIWLSIIGKRTSMNPLSFVKRLSLTQNGQKQLEKKTLSVHAFYSLFTHFTFFHAFLWYEIYFLFTHFTFFHALKKKFEIYWRKAVSQRKSISSKKERHFLATVFCMISANNVFPALVVSFCHSPYGLVTKTANSGRKYIINLLQKSVAKKCYFLFIEEPFILLLLSSYHFRSIFVTFFTLMYIQCGMSYLKYAF